MLAGVLLVLVVTLCVFGTCRRHATSVPAETAIVTARRVVDSAAARTVPLVREADALRARADSLTTLARRKSAHGAVLVEMAHRATARVHALPDSTPASVAIAIAASGVDTLAAALDTTASALAATRAEADALRTESDTLRVAVSVGRGALDSTRVALARAQTAARSPRCGRRCGAALGVLGTLAVAVALNAAFHR